MRFHYFQLCQVMTMRKRIYEIIEVSNDNDRISMVYDILMMCSIFISILPLAFKNSNTFFHIVDIVTAIIFIIDYILRLMTADYKLGHKVDDGWIWRYIPCYNGRPDHNNDFIYIWYCNCSIAGRYYHRRLYGRAQ